MSDWRCSLVLLASLLAPVVAGADADPVGPRVGLAGANPAGPGRAAQRAELTVAGPGLLDYTFGSAPTDWRPSAGHWSVSSRYACDPTWSFFGGESRGLACVWNKRRFQGDLLFEVYAAFKYGLSYTETVWLEKPSDICLTICGDGEEPSSGYSFIFGGRNGSVSMIKRGTATLAETGQAQFLPPAFTDQRPDREDMHWRWWRLEARLSGQRVEFWIDGRKACEAIDPAPLRGGQVAIWTVSNGLVVARARIAGSETGEPARPVLHTAAPAPLPGGRT